jgi:WD40 repeat protein
MTPKRTLLPRPRALLLLLLLLLCLCAASATFARQQQTPPQQQPCQQPVVSAASRARSMFTPQQEMDLGDVIAEQVQRDYRVIDDDEAAGFLRRVGERLVKQLPPTEMRYRFFLVDEPDVNAFAMVGGRIYVTRKLVAFARSEDELAGVLGHELGHLATGQTAAEWTRIFRNVLKVEQLGDRRDIFEKYNQILENVARKPGVFREDEGHEESQQMEADRVGLYAAAAAGYDPQAAASFFDRVLDTKGNTGGWLSDLFGKTKPEARRLREIIKGLQTLPAECRAARAAAPEDEFKRWQMVVVNYAVAASRKEALHSVVSKTTMEPALRADIQHLRFSPDGHYLLAQDDSGITVLAREPLAPLFRIDAPEAKPAHFTPDSQGVVFHNAALRVEAWDVASKKQKSVREMYVKDGCLQTELSPDGQTLACVERNFALTLYDVASNAVVVQKKDFFKGGDRLFFMALIVSMMGGGEGIDFGNLLDALIGTELVSMHFSPDGHYFAAGQGNGNATDTSLVYDLKAGSDLKPLGSLKRMLKGKFSFVGTDRVVSVNQEDNRKSAVLSFPDGRLLEEFPLGGTPDAATRGDYVMLRPVKDYPVGVFDLAAKKIVMANRQNAFDVYGDMFVSERINGELGLYRFGAQAPLATVLMPRNPLGRLRAAAVSADMRWLAVSELNRGAVWDLKQGTRVFHVRGFRGATFGDDGALYADFPKFKESERTIARLDPATGEMTERVKIEVGGEWQPGWTTQSGPYLVSLRPAKKDGSGVSGNVTLSVSDAQRGEQLWTRAFPKESPRVFTEAREDTMLLVWDVKTEHARAEIKADPALARRLAEMKEKEGDYYLQAVEARTGRALGALLVETGKGSFRISDAFSVGEWVVVSDTQNRVLLYSLADGEPKGRFFGTAPVVSKAAALLAVTTERGQLTLFDLATSERRDRFDFASPVSLAQFSADGRRLFVLTADQTAYVLDLSQPAPTR